MQKYSDSSTCHIVVLRMIHYLCKVKHKYHRDIFEILASAGEKGMPVRLIALQVYNRNTGLFTTGICYKKIYQLTRWYLWYQSQRPSSPFIHRPERGQYTLKKDIGIQKQIDFELIEEKYSQEEKKKEEFEYPSLF